MNLAESINQVVALSNQGHFDLAEKNCKLIQKKNPDYFIIHKILGSLYIKKGLFVTAKQELNQYLYFQPNDYQIIHLLATVEIELGNLDFAEHLLLKIQTNILDQTILLDLALIQKKKGFYKKSIALCKTIKDPEWAYVKAQYMIANCYLCLGCWQEGFTLFEYRHHFNSMGQLLLANNLTYQSVDFSKNFLVIREQGIGDEIFFSCCYSLLIQKYHKNCKIVINSRLKKLFKRSFQTVNIESVEELQQKNTAISNFIMSGSLFLFFNIMEQQFHHWIKLCDEKVSSWKEKLSKDKINIGFAWRGGRNLEFENERSFNVKLLSELLATPNSNWINLQHGLSNDEIEFLQSNENVQFNLKCTDLSLSDMDDFASLIGALDCIVTVENSLALIAGAIGIKTILIATTDCHWYWSKELQALGWFPNVTILRKTSYDENWIKNIHVVKKMLLEYMKIDT